MELPKGAEVIRIDNVEGHIYMWAVVDPDAPTETRQFHARKTGAENPCVPDNVRYLDCAAIYIQMELMLYYFEPIPENEQ